MNYILSIGILGIIMAWLMIGNTREVNTLILTSVFIVGALFYGILNFHFSIEYILYFIFGVYFIGITSIIVFTYTGKMIFCDMDLTLGPAIFAGLGIIIFGTLIFNLVFMNPDANSMYSKFLIIALYYGTTALLVYLLNFSLDDETTEPLTRLLKILTIPFTIYIICFNNFFTKLSSMIFL